MTEENNHDKYIVRSNCKCKYINDEEHMSTDFGYTRLEERYKTCVKCRAKKKVHRKTYYEKHKNKRIQQEILKSIKKKARNTMKNIKNKLANTIKPKLYVNSVVKK